MNIALYFAFVVKMLNYYKSDLLLQKQVALNIKK